MAKIERFEDVRSWQMARELANMIYPITRDEMFARDFGLKDQIRRAAGSVMHNIAEGFDAGSDAEFVRYLLYARRSATEVQSQLYLAMDQKYITATQFNQLYGLSTSCKKSINALISYLKKRPPNHPTNRPPNQ